MVRIFFLEFRFPSLQNKKPKKEDFQLRHMKRFTRRSNETNTNPTVFRLLLVRLARS